MVAMATCCLCSSVRGCPFNLDLVSGVSCFGLPVYLVLQRLPEFSSIPNRTRKEMVYLTTHSTHFIYSYMALDSDSERGNPHPPLGYFFRLAARVLLYPSHRQDSPYHGLCYTSRGALAGTINSSMGPPHVGSIRRPIAP